MESSCRQCGLDFSCTEFEEEEEVMTLAFTKRTYSGVSSRSYFNWVMITLLRS